MTRSQLSLDDREKELDEKAQTLAAKERRLRENGPEREDLRGCNGPKDDTDATGDDPAEPEMSATVTEGNSEKTLSQNSK
eukprot:4013000-Pyramimonas_sp.AAC.1